jgi:hypothetical protein
MIHLDVSVCEDIMIQLSRKPRCVSARGQGAPKLNLEGVEF